MPDLSSLFRRGMLGITERTWVNRLFTEYPLGRRLATRFVAGEELPEAVVVARVLNDRGISVSMDHLGEHVHDNGSAAAALSDYLACLDQIEAERLDANISVKLTQLGLGVDRSLALAALETLAKRAAEVGSTVTDDMEESTWTDATIELYSDVQPRFGNLGVAVQADLHRTEFRIAEGVRRDTPITSNLKKTSLADALQKMLAPHNLTFRVVDGRILIESASTKPETASKTPDESGVEIDPMRKN